MKRHFQGAHPFERIIQETFGRQVPVMGDGSIRRLTVGLRARL